MSQLPAVINPIERRTVSGPLTHWLPPLLAGAASITMVFFLWRRRRATGATALIVMMIGAALWALMSALHRVVPDLPAKVLVAKFQYLAILTAPLAFFVFALQYTGRDKWVTFRNLVLLAIIPAVTLALVWSNEAHRLIWSHVGLDTSGPVPLGVYSYGPWFWLTSSYAYALLFIGTVWLVRSFILSPRLYRMQVAVLLLSLSVPWLANVLYVFGISPIKNLDLTSIAFNVTCLALAWGLFGYRLSDVAPVARQTVFEGMTEAVIVLDVDGRLVDFNPAAGEIIGPEASLTIGRSAAEAFAGLPELARAVEAEGGGMSGVGISLMRGGVARYFDLRLSELMDARGRRRGRLIVLSDVTDRRMAELEREELISRLQRALAEVKALSGLLPICSSCKKIRDDQGYWQQIEVYIRDHSEADFSHGICPDCKKKLYPELANPDPNKK